jgi:WS/DGAT/MGAT family acyltransferase
MSERMSSADVAFFYLEGRTAPQHVGGIAIFEPPADGFDYERLVRLLEERISLVPRYRQKVREIPARIANPVWVDDPNFDITYHVRRSALPRPGTDAQLLEFAARIQSRLLDRNRPLWEMYLVEGLSGDRVAIVSKTHSSMIDGLGSIDIAQVILDEAPEPRRTVEKLWMPEPEPSATSLVVDAVTGMVHHPTTALESVRLGMSEARTAAGRVAGLTTRAVSSAAAVVRHATPSPLSASLSEQRRIAIARTDLDHYRRVRRVHGGTVNGVVLATVAGALRRWLLQREQVVSPSLVVRALAPVSVAEDHDRHRDASGRVTPLLVNLPVGEPDAALRLARLNDELGAHVRSGRAVAADALVRLSGFAPPTLHALGARAGAGITRRAFSIMITNVPGPQVPLYAAGARMTEMVPVIPLTRGHAVAVGLTSYDGGVYYGLTGDRDAMPDIELLAQFVEDALAELVEVSADDAAFALAGRRTGRRTAPRRPGRTPREPSP